MTSNLLERVVDKNRRCIDLRDQRGGLTASVLESLRVFLRHNDLYIHLCVSDNVLRSEALAELCALVKRHPYLTSLEVQHCGLHDKDFCFYFGPALISMPHLTFVDLSRNSGLTDSSAETVARLLLETEVQSVRLIGTSFTVVGGQIIAAAVANTTALIHCELPFTVGNVVLDAVATQTRRNRAHRERITEANAQYTRLRVSRCRLPSLPGLRRIDTAQAVDAGVEVARGRGDAAVLPPSSAAPPGLSSASQLRSASPRHARSPHGHVFSGESSEDRQWRACISKGRRQSWVRPEPAAATPAASVLLPLSPARERQSPTPSSVTAYSTPVNASALSQATTASSFPPSPPPSVTRCGKATPDSLEAVTMWDWADPAMSTALRCLFVLDRQAHVLDQHRSAAAPPTVIAATAAVAPAARGVKGSSRSRRQYGAAAYQSESSSGVTDSPSLPSLRSP